ncbi:MAG: tetratricopeptide repeat protein [Spirochaetaceae bacterium]|jgi:tetratricopeptide (TPR) repeat protein|nr:tetratricopeptide repeat protein [Spirochaetaceae bacterium]
MLGFLKKLFRFHRPRQAKPDADALIEEKWDADFSKPGQVRFDIKAENSHDAYIDRKALVLGLKKNNCIAWIPDPLYRYGDQVLEARIGLEPLGGYAAAGLMFRIIDEGTFYLALFSSKGYFRLDVVRNNTPLTLVGWTELPGEAETPGEEQRTESEPPSGTVAGQQSGTVALTIIAYGDHLLLLVNGRWAAELRDTTIPAGRIGFCIASYGGERITQGSPPAYTARASLESLSVESRIEEVSARYEAWANSPDIDPRSRFRLAETFTAMDQPKAALAQLQKAWESGAKREAPELLLAGRLALALEQTGEAEAYINACLEAGSDTPAGREAEAPARVEKAKLLYMMGRFEELLEYGEEALKILPHDGERPALWTFLGHVYTQFARYEEAARCYDLSFEGDKENGLPAKNAANAYELAGRPAEALDRYLKAGRVFLAQGNYEDLGSLVPKLLSLGKEHWEARGLLGKWAFGIEDWAMAEKEFSRAETLRKKAPSPRPPEDPALVFLRGLLLLREGKRVKALPLLKKAAALEPDYALFRFRLAETRFLIQGNPRDTQLLADLEAALTLAPEDGWVRNLAAQVALSRGDLDEAAEHLEKAAQSLGEVPAIRVNRGVMYYLRGSLKEALEALSAGKDEDPEGVMANCGGNLLCRSGRYEEADEYYQRALARSPGNSEYLGNRASCLIELGAYGEADAILTQVPDPPPPEILDLIAFVAVKKGEYPRAEAASRAALEADPHYIPSLLSLGWIYRTQSRWDELREIMVLLDKEVLDGEYATRREELARQLEEGVTRLIGCASCGLTWRVPRVPESAPPIRLFAMPPDELPAGTCPECGLTYCIGCAKEHLDPDNRFRCPRCGKTLKLIDEGLKRLIYDWAAGAIPGEKDGKPEESS